MSTVDTTLPIHWTPTAATGPVDTPDEAIEDWLNKNPGVDLNNLSKEELGALIAHLETFSAQAWASTGGLPAVISELKGLHSNWGNSAGLDPIEALKNDAQNRAAVLATLAENTVGQDALDTAAAAAKSRLDTISAAASAAAATTSVWNPNGNTDTIGQVDDTLAKLDALEAQGFDLEALGLSNLKLSLEAAKAAYAKAMAGDPDERQQQIALSEYRESVAQARVDYLKSTGLGEDDPAVRAEMATVEGEAIWQTHLLSKDTGESMLEIPGPTGYSLEELEQYRADLQQQYKFAVASGDTQAQAMIQSKIAITDRAIDDLLAGEDPFATGANFFIELKASDIANLTALEAKARSSGNQELADQLQQQIETETKLVESVMSEYQSIMGKIADVASNAMNGAFN